MARRSAGCAIADCDGAHIAEGNCHYGDGPHKAKGFCKAHYEESRRVYSKRTLPKSHTVVPDEVREIRALYDTGDYTQAELGRKFGVSGKAVSEIVNRKTWPSIE